MKSNHLMPSSTYKTVVQVYNLFCQTKKLERRLTLLFSCCSRTQVYLQFIKLSFFDRIKLHPKNQFKGRREARLREILINTNTLSVQQMVAFYTLIMVHKITMTRKPAHLAGRLKLSQ